MRWLFFSFFFLPVISSTQTICFFELDNITTSKNFTRQKPNNVKIHTFSPKSSYNSSKGFKAMIDQTNKDGKRCDSLVISGHHTGNWYGEIGSLKLKELEKLSCDPKYSDWFKNIQALWLDGCNTVTDNAVQATTLPPSSDSETVRVSDNETEIDRPISEGMIRDLNQAYTLSLDKNTPLSSRYLRAFPNTQIYGFNGAAPTGSSEANQKGNQSLIADHLSKIGKALKAEKRLQKHQQNQTNIQNGIDALTLEYCDEDRIEAWENINSQTEAIENQNYTQAKKLGCDLILAKQILDNPNSSPDEKAEAKKSILNTLDKILKEENSDNKLSLSHLLFNNIYETWATAKKYKTKDKDFFKAVKNKLKSDSENNFQTSLKDRINSDQNSSIRKADYIKFYMEVNDIDVNAKPEFITTAIKDLLEKSKKLFPELKSPRNKNLPERSKKALALSVADQLLQYDLLTPEQKKELLDNKKLFPTDTNDAFEMSVKMRFKFSAQGTDAVFNELTASKLPKKEEGSAMTALSRHYFNQLNQVESDPSQNLDKLYELTQHIQNNPENTDLQNSFWSELVSHFNKKSKDEAEHLIDQYISKSKSKSKSNSSNLLKGFLKIYKKTELNR